MKLNRFFFVGLVASISVFLSSCGTPPPSNWPGLASDGKTVYLADGQYVYFIRASDGVELTTTTTDGTGPLRFPAKADGSISFSAAPVFTADGQMIVGNASTVSSNHPLYSINPTAGSINWTFPGAKGIWLASAAVGDGAIFAPAGDGTLHALDLKGNKLWDAVVSDHSLWSAPVTDGKLVYVGTLGHEIVALDVATGKQRWKVELDNAMVGAPAVTPEGVLYIGTLSGDLYALKTEDGSQVWPPVKLEGSIWSTPAIDGDTLYIGTSSGTAGKLYAINIANGNFAWEKPVDDEGSIIASPLVAKDQVIYVTETGAIKFLNKDGSPKGPGAAIPNGKIYTTPLLVGDLLLVAPMNVPYLLAAYDLNGVQKWTFAPK